MPMSFYERNAKRPNAHEQHVHAQKLLVPEERRGNRRFWEAGGREGRGEGVGASVAGEKAGEGWKGATCGR